ncbi:MAG: fimbria major subunit [Firmicutes bacterium]|nr:fimbria major subunit [Bacillota bacterium]MCM1401767.1 fimbria major subunit [Bacteroides sp.]
MFGRLITILFIAACVFSGCSSYDDEPDAPVTGNSGDGKYVRLMLYMPQGGSRGESHPDEGALDNECAVRDITLFIYSASDGLNSNPADSIAESFYLTNTSTEFSQTGTSIELRFKSTNNSITEGYRLAAFINMGDLTHFKVLGDLQAHIPASTWNGTGTLSSYTGFTMANANATDGLLSCDPLATSIPGSKENPLTTSIEVERTSARIDLDYTGSSREGEFLVYPARLASDGTEVATVYVSHVLPVNAMQESSYALKRISAPATDNLSCLMSYTFTGTLPKDDDGHPTAYVVEPHSLLKGLPIGNAAEWYGRTAASVIESEKKGHFTDQNKLVHNLDDPKINITLKNSVVLAYANENTQHIDNHYAGCLTGLVIRAQYVPKTIYVTADLSQTIKNPVRGTDIWRYTPQNSTTTEADVMYFATKDAATEYSHAHSADRAQIKEFKAGECFYNLWIRHTVLTEGPRPDGPVFPMEFGIVRNHIYRVAIGFRGIGREGVTIEDPWNIEPQIFVRPWNMFRHPEIIM